MSIKARLSAAGLWSSHASLSAYHLALSVQRCVGTTWRQQQAAGHTTWRRQPGGRPDSFAATIPIVSGSPWLGPRGRVKPGANPPRVRYGLVVVTMKRIIVGPCLMVALGWPDALGMNSSGCVCCVFGERRFAPDDFAERRIMGFMCMVSQQVACFAGGSGQVMRRSRQVM